MALEGTITETVWCNTGQGARRTPQRKPLKVQPAAGTMSFDRGGAFAPTSTLPGPVGAMSFASQPSTGELETTT